MIVSLPSFHRLKCNRIKTGAYIDRPGMKEKAHYKKIQGCTAVELCVNRKNDVRIVLAFRSIIILIRTDSI